MKRLFADTFYYVALLSGTDEHHHLAVQWSQEYRGKQVTTAWVITELVDPFSSMEKRVKLHKVLNSILTNPNLEIVPPSRELFEAGLDLHCRRDDKSWSLTDCISFIVMERYELTDALTRDHHLRQAGFNTLLN